MNFDNCERLIAKKAEGKLLFAKICLIILYIVFTVVSVLLAILYGSGGAPALIVLALIAACLLIFFTWRFTCIEYEYTIAAKSFYLAKIFGKSHRRELFENDLIHASVIAPYIDKYKSESDNCNAERTYNALSSDKTDTAWFIIFEGEDGKKTIIFFEADDKLLLTLRHQCPRVIAKEAYSIKHQKNNEETDNAELQ